MSATVHPIEFAELEREAERLYRSAGFDPTEPAKMLDLAKKALRNGVRSVPDKALPSKASLVRIGSEWVIFHQKSLPPKTLRFAIAHELAHWCLGIDSSSEDNEATCDLMAACLVAPRVAFNRATDSCKANYRKLAKWFGATETCVALRYGEVTNVPLALVAPGNVRMRGESYEWGDLRKLARSSTIEGISVTSLSDAPARRALRVLRVA